MAILRAPGLGRSSDIRRTPRAASGFAPATRPTTRPSSTANGEPSASSALCGTGKTPKIGDAWYFRLPREFDRTGTFVLGSDRAARLVSRRLRGRRKGRAGQAAEGHRSPSRSSRTPNTSCAWARSRSTIPMPDDETVPDWELRDRLPNIDKIKDELLNARGRRKRGRLPHVSAQRVRSRASMSFMLGSCRYPGLLWKIKEADRIFAPICEHFDAGQRRIAARFTMMCGDQIYADTLNKNIPLLRADTTRNSRSATRPRSARPTCASCCEGRRPT